MININDDCDIEIKGDKVQVLYQVRGLIETLAEVKEFEEIFKDKKLTFFNPTASRTDIRKIIEKVEEE